jgi:hypothetical protein
MSTYLEKTTKLVATAVPPIAKSFKFVYGKEVVTWQVSYSRQLSTTIALISCDHKLFKQYFPDGFTRIHTLLQLVKNESGSNPHRSFFVNLVDSYNIQ